MIAGRLINQYVRDRDYRLSDEALKQRIETTPSFLRDGQFNSTLYRDLLRSNGYTTQTYEAGERQSAAIEQLSSSLADFIFRHRSGSQPAAGAANANAQSRLRDRAGQPL